LQNIAHPHRNPQTGPSVSLRNTYTPPVRGYTDDSSAHTSDPKSVSTPAASHTASTPAIVGTCRFTSDGCTKMDAPMMMPTTIAAACGSPIGRSSDGLGEAVGKALLQILFEQRQDALVLIGPARGLDEAVILHRVRRHGP